MVEIVYREHGRWVDDYDPDADIFFQKGYRCSVCGDRQTYGKTDFCPRCGADLREKEEVKS